MPFNRTISWVAIGLFAILMASPALAQGPEGAQLFAPAELSTYGAPHVQPHEGYFFSFDGMYWSVSRPKTTLIGAVGFRDVGTRVQQVFDIPPDEHPEIETFAETSTEDTSALTDNFQAAQRFEFGRVEDNRGWLMSIFRWGPGEQNFSSTQANVLFDDPIDPTTGHGLLFGRIGDGTIVIGDESVAVQVDGDLPIVFNNIAVHNDIDLWSVEASYLRRAKTFHNGGNLEVYLGARYMEFNESFGVLATGGVLDRVRWNMDTGNHMIGPQVGGRYFKQQGRWIFSTEGRFMAAYNRQNLFQEGEFAYTGTPGDIQRPFAWMGAQYSHRTTVDEFTPVAELRFDFRYVITRYIDFRVGWTGMYMNGIARPQNMISYAVPTMGIDATNNRQDVFVNGVTIGFDVNR